MPVLAAFAFANLKHDLAAVWAWLCHRSFWQLVSLGLAIFALVQHFELVHTRHAAAGWEAQFKSEKTAFDQTVANYRAAAEQAKKDDAANKVRVEAEQAQVNERTDNDFQARLAAARAQLDRLRRASAANFSGSAGTVVPVLPPSSSGIDESAADGLSDAFTCTAQGIQLDELIKWVNAQHAIDPNQGAKK